MVQNYIYWDIKNLIQWSRRYIEESPITLSFNVKYSVECFGVLVTDMHSNKADTFHSIQFYPNQTNFTIFSSQNFGIGGDDGFEFYSFGY